MRLLTIALLTALIASCGNHDDNEQKNTSRTIRYELTGNFSGTNIIAAYTTTSGATVTEGISSLPWNKEITFDTSVGGASIVVSGAGGIVGQHAAMVIRKGGSQFGTPLNATVDAGGTFTISSPVISF